MKKLIKAKYVRVTKEDVCGARTHTNIHLGFHFSATFNLAHVTPYVDCS